MENPNDMPTNGFLYCHISESKIHSFEDYATTYVTSEFVQKAVMGETDNLYYWKFLNIYGTTRMFML